MRSRRPQSNIDPEAASLPLRWRLLLGSGSFCLAIVGVMGLVLPGLQGVLTLILSAALLSVCSDSVHRWLGRRLDRWPRAWETLNRFRSRILRGLSPD